MVAVKSMRRPNEGEEALQVELPPDVFLGRQPILDLRGQLWGYELLYRADGGAKSAQIDSPMAATSTVVINLLAEFGIEQVVGRARMLINCPTEALDPSVVAMLPQEQVVLEVLEDVEATQDNLARLKVLVDEGFTLALDDYSTDDSRSPLLRLASIVKVDLSLVKPEDLEGVVARLKHFKVTLLAEKVETREELERTKALGFTLFQGFYFCRPEIVKGKRPPANQLAVLRLLSKVNDPKTESAELAKLIGADVGLSFRLLRCLNSAAFTFARKVATVEHAMMLLGESRLRKWVSMLAVSGIPNKPSELSRVALLRAHMCEQLAAKVGGEKLDRKAAFTVGLFSVLDTMLDVKMEKIVKELPLGRDVTRALLGKPGVYGGIFAAVMSYEQGNWQELASLGLKAEEVTAIWMDATRTMEEAFDSLRADAAQEA